MARSTRSRRTTAKHEESETQDVPNQEADVAEKTPEKKSRRGRKHESKDAEQKEEVSRAMEQTPEVEGNSVQSEVTEKGRRGGRKKREVETESEQRSSSTKRARSQRAQKEDRGEPIDGDGTSGRGKEKREEKTEVMTAPEESDGQKEERHHPPQEEEQKKKEQKEEEQKKKEQKEEEQKKEDEEHKETKKDSQHHERSSEKSREKASKFKNPPESKSLKSASSDNQKALRMEVEEEKLDFEIEDELQLKVQNDEVLDGDDEETKEDERASRTIETSGEKSGKDSKDEGKDSVSTEKLNALDEMLKKRASRRNQWTSEKEGGSDKDKENLKDALRDRWGKLAEKGPSKEHAQTIVTTDSLKELSKELEAKVVKKDATNEKEPLVSDEKKEAVPAEEGKVASDEDKTQPEEDAKKTQMTADPGLEDRRRARHISMSETTTTENTAKETTKDETNGKAKPPSAGLALGSTNWTELEATRRKPRESATPPRSSVSRHLLVLNLVRPFTLGQLTDLLTHSGTRPVSDLWLDRIKSKAIVEFADNSASQEAREELHNIVWPKGSPKTIKCEFLTEEEVEQTKAGSIPSAKKDAAQSSNKDKTKKETPKERTRIVMGPSEESRGDNGDLRRTIEVHKEKSGEESRRRPIAADADSSQAVPPKKIREWDLPKLKQQQPLPPPPHQQQRQQQPETEEPATTKRLEDLFRKTKATPNIYWIPLPENVAVEKAKIRAEKQKEDDRRNRNRWLIH